jgi:hypothetical protein
MAKMSPKLKDFLRCEAVSPEVVGALEVAMVNAPSASLEAGVYAHGMEAAYHSYGVEGVKTQVLYLLSNLARWRGDQARATKAVLKRFK